MSVHYVVQRSLLGVALVGALIFILTAVFNVSAVSYEKGSIDNQDDVERALLVDEIQVEEPFVVTHLQTPESVKAVYMSSWVAATPSIRDKIINLVDDTEINAVVIDIKDSTGKVSFLVDDETVNQYGSTEDRIKNIQEFIQKLHDKNIYVIGRISVFQDPYLSPLHPELAIKKKSDGTVWKDKKGLSFLDPSNQDVWKYIVAIAHEGYRLGFDEINFDYIRFPSDGNIVDIVYGLDDTSSRADVIESFFKYLHTELITTETKIPMSADLFGMVTTVNDDLGIGQVLERALPYFDAIAPMIYPSHYPKNWNNFANPADHPYDVITLAMQEGIGKAAVVGFDQTSFRPWIQDFNLGATYTADMVKAQIQALEDLDIDSWMVWDPANTYTESAFRENESL